MVLSYVAMQDYMGDMTDMTREEEILHHVSLNEPMFDQYYKRVMWFIKKITIGMPAYYWIKQVKCGHIAMHKLWDHYNDTYEG